MALRSLFLILALLFSLAAQDKVDWVCPMDKDVHMPAPGNCPRCGMKLVPGLPDPTEYPVRLTITPRAFHKGDNVALSFRIVDPATGKPVTKFETVHDKLFHLFIVSRDLSFFAHEHPDIQPDGTFRLQARLPLSGEYRLLCDFYPAGGTPQLIAKTLIAPGPSAPTQLKANLAPQSSTNMDVSLTMEPAQPIAGTKTMLFLHVNPSEGLEPYLGAWGHMLVASADGIDLIHTHPAFGEAAASIQFNVLFPRPGVHRIWVQFQRLGKVNTVSFDVPVAALR
jgi:hypothetical protein